jgi:hypothetical protein
MALSHWSIIKACFNTKTSRLSILLHQKITFKYCLTLKISFIYHLLLRNIWNLANYHKLLFKSKNSLKRDDTRNIIQALFNILVKSGLDNYWYNNSRLWVRSFKKSVYISLLNHLAWIKITFSGLAMWQNYFKPGVSMARIILFEN